MHLGWIDYSEEDRKNLRDALALLSTPDAVDELGVGSIRGAFADLLFPSTSTVQTRAKYFFIVSYLLREAALWNKTSDTDAAMEKLDAEERACANLLRKEGGDGIIGKRNLPNKWVSRAPSSIYWNGIKRLKIFTRPELSIRDYISFIIQNRNVGDLRKYGNARDDTDESDRDDSNAGTSAASSFWDLPISGHKNWREGLSTQLLPEEASFLRSKIETELSGTLFAYLLKNDIRPSSYKNIEQLYEAVSKSLPDSIKSVLFCALNFTSFMYPAYAQYNLMASGGIDKSAEIIWRASKNNLRELASLDLNRLFAYTKPSDIVRLRIFLERLKRAYASENKEEIRDAVKKREIEIKGFARAKAANPGKFYKGQLLGAIYIDYRFGTAGRIIDDIMFGENHYV